MTADLCMQPICQHQKHELELGACVNSIMDTSGSIVPALAAAMSSGIPMVSILGTVGCRDKKIMQSTHHEPARQPLSDMTADLHAQPERQMW